MRLTTTVIAGFSLFALALGGCPRDDAKIVTPQPPVVVTTPAAAPSGSAAAPAKPDNGVHIRAGKNGGEVNVENGQATIGVRFGKDGNVDLEVDKDE
ncbi:MAG: hypothetical protein KC635_29895 [Myxococcales bacterium]|nr:hypothetical protein [Myxococcales bacterium]MCB9734744.1 hypothetical protein [Deltaproteobacteria bacterium]